MSDVIVGIDLGTTNSAVAAIRDGQIQVLPNALGKPLTPSAVAWNKDDDTILVGRAAKDIAALHPDRAALMFKRSMGTDRSYAIGPKSLTAVECSALVLKQLREDASRALGGSVVRCVITVPAYFNEAQRFATQKAGELAGFIVERILNEPTAAAIAHGQHQRGKDGTLLVFDLGGGTFDVCVMDRFEGALEVRSVAGESDLGGEDFTRRIASLALERAGLSYEVVEMRAPQAVSLVTKRAELLKRKAGASDDEAIPFTLRIPAIQGVCESKEVALTRKDIEASYAPLLERMVGPLRTALRGAELNRTDIDTLVMVGGATRTPKVCEFVERYFEIKIRAKIDADLAVVMGAAAQAGLYSNDEAVADLVVTDIASHSLGVDVTKTFGTRRESGFFSPVIHRNSVLPTSQSSTYHTMDANQTGMVFGIYEGESRHVSENRKIGEVIVKGIPKGPAGQEVALTFTFDLNGILEVEAVIPRTGKRFSKVFRRDGKDLTPEQLEAMATTFAKIKSDPRDNAHIQEIMARAELLMQDLPPTDRQQVEHLLDLLESALRERNPEDITLWVNELQMRCDSMEGGERW